MESEKSQIYSRRHYGDLNHEIRLQIQCFNHDV